MEPNTNKRCRVEVKNLRESTGWQPLWEFEVDQYTAHEDLVHSLNQLNAPVELRIAYISD